MFDIITLGDCTIDTFIIIDNDEAKLQCNLKNEECQLCLNFADKIPIKDTHQSVGGNAANVAVGCQKLNLNTAIVTELGDDLNGFTIQQDLLNAKVNTNLLKISSNRETRYAVVLNYKGERTVLSYFGKFKYSNIKLPKTNWLYYTSLGYSFEKIQDDLIKYLKKNPQTKLALNPGSYQIKNNIFKLKQILPYTNLIFVNKEEGAKLTTGKKDIKTIIKTLHKAGIKTAVVTDGTKGAYASDGKQIYFMKPYPIKAIDKTGAGDAFASGFISAFINKKNIDEAMQWGTSNAGSVIQKIGAEAGLLNKLQILKTIKKYHQNKPQLI